MSAIDSPGSRQLRAQLRAAVLPGLLLALVHAAVSARPAALTPLDITGERQWTEWGSDFTRRHAFDFSRSLQLAVTIEALLLPQEGNAELLFSLSRDMEDSAPSLHPGQIYHAVLQHAPAVRRRGLGRQLGVGERATLRGWPALESAGGPVVLLVEELVIEASGQRLRLHDQARIQRFRRRLHPTPPRESD